MAQLCLRQDEFKKLNTEVLVISFGSLKQARLWIKQTCSPFRMLLEPERKVYRAYGLKRSLLGSWNLRTVRFYVRMLRSGRRLYGIQGDTLQLGGDFIVDAGGIVRLAHRSRYATDRPLATDLLDILRKLSSKSQM